MHYLANSRATILNAKASLIDLSPTNKSWNLRRMSLHLQMHREA